MEQYYWQKMVKLNFYLIKGLANRSFNINYSDDTRFHIFSLTKTFTAVLIMQLYEKGKINLDSTISTYYPEYKGEAGKKATIKNLLTYSSGRENKDISSPELIHQAYDHKYSFLFYIRLCFIENGLIMNAL